MKLSKFEALAIEHGISPEDYEACAECPEIKAYCIRERNSKFVPELLLKLLGVQADAWSGGRAERVRGKFLAESFYEAQAQFDPIEV